MDMPISDEPYGLQRFVDAQDRAYDTVIDELRDGRKRRQTPSPWRS
jgi:uncharacterized protein (DUF1810 family)